MAQRRRAWKRRPVVGMAAEGRDRRRGGGSEVREAAGQDYAEQRRQGQ